ncbi:tRNA (adenosine(37)-N6)-threonylcarbamoyltransferase complex transferase subunit TsaD, partial [Candidatus Woesebacteria bacterium]|nr:tRNA (adenosine(37)-N6)-threonylcarbamoyltransferase complex transferase subunit TsaD [Candidatus Woesebacteria bacterium]
MNNSLILAIDTSCDDTAAAVTKGTTVLSNVIASQTQLHQPYGGVFPTVAKQAHKENI